MTFPGLETDNYKWYLYVMSGTTVISPGSILSEKAKFDVVPNQTFLGYKAPIEIQEGVTVGVTAGNTSFVFDGSGGTYDWRGWEIYVERVGTGTMQRDVQYSWDKITGTFSLLQLGDVIQTAELYNVEFDLRTDISTGGISPTKLFSDTLVVTGTTSLAAGDIGKNVIIKGATSSFEIELPDITLVAHSVLTYIEAGIGNHTCVVIKTQGGQTIDWLKGTRANMKIGVCEGFAIYKEKLIDQWRIKFPDGHFKTVGELFFSDAEISDLFNCLELNGQNVDVTNYKRLYEDYVQQLPPSQVVSYATWTTGDNIRKFSFKDTVSNNFRVPDLRNLYLRNTDGTNIPGAYMNDSVGPHRHDTKGGYFDGGYDGGGNQFFRIRTALAGLTDTQIMGDTGTGIGTDTKPKTRVSKLFVRV